MPLQELTREFAETVARQHPTLQTLSLARNALTHVRFLELLPPLRRLDLSGNTLRALPTETAQWGATLAFLDLSDNALESLQQLRFCRALETLRAGGNRVALFSELKYLQSLDQLQELTLEGNPIARQPFYRREVVAMLPQLRRLDGRDVTSAERLVASLQQKPLLLSTPIIHSTTTGDVDLVGPTATDAPVDATPALDLSGASHTWSAQVPMESLCSRSVSPSSVSSAGPPAASPSSSSLSLSLRRQLLTPASLRQPVRVVDVSVQAASSASLASVARLEGDEDTTVIDRDVGKRVDVKSVNEPPHEPETLLLQSRVSALERILTLQDTMLADELVQLGTHHGSTAVKDPVRAARVYTQLLATWRHKVVALMVQLQAMELQHASSPGHNDGADASTRIAVERVRDELGRQLDVWKQKCNDALAQRDLERVRAEQAKRQCDGAETKVVRVVRTLATERDRVRTVAEDVALFCSKEGAMTSHMDVLAHETQRLMAFETRLRMLSERMQLASRLVAHREARLRNSEAAIEAERRMWHHKTAAVAVETNADAEKLARSRDRKLLPSTSSLLRLRPATEQALRLLFHRLDPYATGLVNAEMFLNALQADLTVRDALGSGDTGENKRKRLADHVEHEMRARSPFSGIGGTLTWGEVLLMFMPAVEKLVGEDDQTTQSDTSQRLLLTVDELGVPRRFEDDVGATNNPVKRLAKGDRQRLQALSKAELVALVMTLRSDRTQLQRRVMEDAQHLQRRVANVEKQWTQKAGELVHANDELHRQLQRETERARDAQTKLEAAERAAGEAQYQLQSLRRQLSEQTVQFASQKSELEAQRIASVEREQQVWQRELQDMAFQQTQLQSENAKLELNVRQLERELTKQRDQRERHASVQVQHLEEKIEKRDTEIAKLRRERSSLLNAVREQERKSAQHAAERATVRTADTATQTATSGSTSTHSTGVQVDLSLPNAAAAVRDRRMRLDEIAPSTTDASTVPSTSAMTSTSAPALPVAASGATRIAARDLQRRLQHLESLTESLLAD